MTIDSSRQKSITAYSALASGISLILGVGIFNFIVLPAAGSTAETYLVYLSDKAWLVQFLYFTQIIAVISGIIAIIYLFFIMQKAVHNLLLIAAILCILGLLLNGGITDSAMIAYIPLSRLYISGGEAARTAVTTFTAMNTYQAAIDQTGALLLASGLVIASIWFKVWNKDYTFLGLPTILTAMGMLPFGMFGAGWPQSVFLYALSWSIWTFWVSIRLFLRK